MQWFCDGILGMWFGGDLPASSKTSLFVPKLKADGVISEATFSFYMDLRTDSSYMDFGTPDPAMATDVVWLDVLADSRVYSDWQNWWVNEVRGLYWQGEEPRLYKLRALAALTDTGSSCIHGPGPYIRYLKDTILSQVSATTETVDSWEHYFDCDERSSLPSFYLLFGEHWFEVSPYDYAPEVNTGNRCALCLTEDEEREQWTLGAAFLRGWYSIHDYEEKMMGFSAIQARSLGQKSKPGAVTD